MRTSELIGPALDYAVAKCEEGTAYKLVLRPFGHAGMRAFMLDISPSSAGGGWWPHYSTDWAQGGPIIEREGISIRLWIDDGWCAYNELEGSEADGEDYVGCSGPTPLIAAMRCFVASKLGDEIAVPEELTCQ